MKFWPSHGFQLSCKNATSKLNVNPTLYILGLYAYYTLSNGTGIESYVIRAEFNETKVSFFSIHSFWSELNKRQKAR